MDIKRVVVTGIGILCPLGNNLEDAWENAKAGNSGIDFIEQFDSEPIAVHIAGEIKDFDAIEQLGRTTARRTDRAQQFGLLAAKQALQDAGLPLEDNGKLSDEYAEEIGCFIGTGIGSVISMAATVTAYNEKGQRGVRPTIVPVILSDQIAAQISIDYNLQGPNQSIISACSSSNNAIGDAADVIRLGRSKMMLAGGSEACVMPIVMSGFDNVKTLTHYEEDPTKASRPFDATRSGFVAGEAAALLVLEELEHAQARGAKIYAEVTGYGHTSDAFHVTAPHPEGLGAARAMNIALKEADLQPTDISYINAHGTGTKLNDSSETLAIKHTFGEDAYNIPISSTKSMTGHMLGASAAVEAVFSIMAIRDNMVPPTINLNDPDPECDLDYVPNTAREVAVKHVMSNSFGFGGHNAVLIVSEYAG